MPRTDIYTQKQVCTIRKLTANSQAQDNKRWDGKFKEKCKNPLQRQKKCAAVLQIAKGG